MKKMHFIFLLMIMGLFCACGNQLTPEPVGKKKESRKLIDSAGKMNISLACWNTQTFFDAVSDGCEYQDFLRPEKWTKEKYSKRLDRLCEIMALLSSDIMVLVEIENEAVVQDITNRLAASEWNKKQSWQYVCFAKEPGAAIGCAVFSRFELCDMKVHSLDIRTQKIKQPSSRPIIQVTAKTGEKELVVFVNHWKSKSGGEEESEIWRDWQEAVLAEKMREVVQGSNCNAEERIVVACGDFNRGAEDFIIHPDRLSGTNFILRSSDGAALQLYTPWLDLNGRVEAGKGSYYYKDEWERIDNIFSIEKGVITRFQAVNIPPLVDEEGKPQAYKVYNESGYSDHLPLKCVLLL